MRCHTDVVSPRVKCNVRRPKLRESGAPAFFFFFFWCSDVHLSYGISPVLAPVFFHNHQGRGFTISIELETCYR